MIDNRYNDSIVEREIASFIDANLYEDKSIFKNYYRTDTKDEQISGSDVVLSTSDGRINDAVVDEKVAARYANCGLSTFSLELSFIGRGGKWRRGWFIDHSKKTEYYLFGWLNKVDIPFDSVNNRFNTDLITKDNIRELEYCLVSRDRILSFLAEKGWTVERLKAQDDKIRSRGCVSTKDFIDGMSFRFSGNYVEKPINILLKKDTYITLSEYNGIIKV